MKSQIISLAAAGLIISASTAQAGEWNANFAASNNYIWRGLTQTINEAAVSGGIDYMHDSGFYAGTWVSNVSYAADDVYSYEHDMYLGFAGEASGINYDIGYLYYNYDDEAEFDFGEVYGSIGYGGFTVGLNILANTEADEGPGQDFGFGEATYLYVDYSTEVGEGIELGLHIGHHEGDFSEAFNGVPGDYVDYNISMSKNGFSFMVSSTDLDDVGPDNLDNDEVKFVVSYGIDFEL
ncbi:MAG: TorF family putative porin [Gammaproteobacteria bacterium]